MNQLSKRSNHPISTGLFEFLGTKVTGRHGQASGTYRMSAGDVFGSIANDECPIRRK